MKKLLLLLTILFSLCTGHAQSCNFPGALLSVKTTHKGNAEFIVFTFMNPHKPKGQLGKTGSGVLIQKPLGTTITVAGKQFYTISFDNPFEYCDTKRYIVPHKKVLDVKPLQWSDGIISYVIGLSDDAKIAAHTAYNYHGVHIVKLRVE